MKPNVAGILGGLNTLSPITRVWLNAGRQRSQGAADSTSAWCQVEMSKATSHVNGRYMPDRTFVAVFDLTQYLWEELHWLISILFNWSFVSGVTLWAVMASDSLGTR